MKTDPTATYNDAEFYALKVWQACSGEFTTGISASAEILSAINEIHTRHGEVGVSSLIAALGRLGMVELSLRAEREGTDVSALVEAWQWHKLQQHLEEDE